MDSVKAEVYRPGTTIRTDRTLQVIDLPYEAWKPIRFAYPELAIAGKQADFYGKKNTTIFPPRYVSRRALKMVLDAKGPGHAIYAKRELGKVVSVLVHIHGKLGYDGLHIYRLRASRQWPWSK